MSLREKLLFGFVAALGVAALGLALLGEQGVKEVRRLKRESDRLSAEISQLRERSRALEKDVRNLRENPEVIAGRARKDLNLIRKGETVFVLPENHEKTR